MKKIMAFFVLFLFLVSCDQSGIEININKNLSGSVEFGIFTVSTNQNPKNIPIFKGTRSLGRGEVSFISYSYDFQNLDSIDIGGITFSTSKVKRNNRTIITIPLDKNSKWFKTFDYTEEKIRTMKELSEEYDTSMFSTSEDDLSIYIKISFPEKIRSAKLLDNGNQSNEVFGIDQGQIVIPLNLSNILLSSKKIYKIEVIYGPDYLTVNGRENTVLNMDYELVIGSEKPIVGMYTGELKNNKPHGCQFPH